MWRWFQIRPLIPMSDTTFRNDYLTYETTLSIIAFRFHSHSRQRKHEKQMRNSELNAEFLWMDKSANAIYTFENFSALSVLINNFGKIFFRKLSWNNLNLWNFLLRTSVRGKCWKRFKKSISPEYFYRNRFEIQTFLCIFLSLLVISIAIICRLGM